MKKGTYFIALLIFLLAGSSFAQKGNLILTFTGIEPGTNNSIDLQSVHVQNLTQSCDTLLYGTTPSLNLSWLGIHDNDFSGGFSMDNCYPNPNTGRTNFTVSTNDKQSIHIHLMSTQGITIAEFENDVVKGAHSFEISGIKTGFYNLIVSSGRYIKSQKIICQNQEENLSVQINYISTTNDNLNFKSNKEINGFGFQPGDQLKFYAVRSGYLTAIIIDNPTENHTYEFEMDFVHNEMFEDFEDAEEDEPIALPYWRNIGSKNWNGEDYDGNKYASARASDEDDILWLVSPIIDFDAKDFKALSFLSAYAFWDQQVASLWFIENMDGNDIANAVKTELSCTFANQNNAEEYEWVSSGTIGLSSFSGLGRIGFKCTIDQPGWNPLYFLDDIEVYTTSGIWECGQVFTDDRDGEFYNSVQIGNQCWMAENLDYVTDGSWAYDGYTSNSDIHGRLYTWDAAMSACPAGWHLPSDDEWKTMEMALGMSQSEADGSGWRGTDEGAKMKETGTANWDPPNSEATNSSGFTARGSGFRSMTTGTFLFMNNSAQWWTSTEHGYEDYVWYRDLNIVTSKVGRNSGSHSNWAISVRCVKD